MDNANYTKLDKRFKERMYDVKQKYFVDVEVELVKLSNERYAVTGVNPTTGMTMFKLFSSKRAKEILGEVTI